MPNTGLFNMFEEDWETKKLNEARWQKLGTIPGSRQNMQGHTLTPSL